jgi:hypothetical protein
MLNRPIADGPLEMKDVLNGRYNGLIAIKLFIGGKRLRSLLNDLFG